MAKVNFTKAENAVAEALQKIMVEQLSDLADIASESAASAATLKDIQLAKQAKERSLILYTLYCDLGRLQRLDRDFYKGLALKKKSLESLMKNLTEITDEQWQKVLTVKDIVTTKLKKLSALYSDDQVLQAQRHKSINQRFNVSDRWIPLE